MAVRQALMVFRVRAHLIWELEGHDVAALRHLDAASSADQRRLSPIGPHAGLRSSTETSSETVEKSAVGQTLSTWRDTTARLATSGM